MKWNDLIHSVHNPQLWQVLVKEFLVETRITSMSIYIHVCPSTKGGSFLIYIILLWNYYVQYACMYFYFGKLCHRCIKQMALNIPRWWSPHIIFGENLPYYLQYLLFRIPEFSLFTNHADNDPYQYMFHYDHYLFEYKITKYTCGFTLVN